MKKSIFLFLLILAPFLPAQDETIAIPPLDASERICFALYTVHENTLKLTAQLYPLQNAEDLFVTLQIEVDGAWVDTGRADVIYPGYTAPFRIDNWDDTKETHYRLNHGNTAYYEGIIRKNPLEKDTITVMAFTGNSLYSTHGGDIPRDDIVANARRIQPDLLFFSGDQVYDHAQHLHAWLRFGRDFGDIISNTPTVAIPDDHDVGQFNLWGEEGVKAETRAGDKGGYVMPVEYVKEVERAQTSHLPDPFDPSPVKRGIGVYYTDLTWGGISFAIIEDRKFKTGPAGHVPIQGPRPDHVATPDYDPESLDVPGVQLLGERQLDFLRHWAADWTGAEMKAVLSQTIFAGGAHIHGSPANRIYADLDSNGWPQTGRNKALAEIRKAFALMIAGDQHLGTVIHHGIDDWNDAGYSLCVPSIANLYLRWWKPLEPGNNRKPGAPAYTGEFFDGFSNKLTMHAVANPSPEPNSDKLTTRAAGFGIVKFIKPAREMVLELWPRNVDITDPGTEQYEGWPIVVQQEENYGREAASWLPELQISKPDQVVQVINEANKEIVYTLRIKGGTFRPKVFEEGIYTIVVGEGFEQQTLSGIEAVKDPEGTLEVEL